MSRRVRVRSLAKINLDLRVLHKRPDGFHELRTIFQTVSLADSLDIEYAPGRTQINLNSNLNISDNIVVKAAHSVLRATRSSGRIGFVLRKSIPLGAGLGGGSSNAAAVLLALPPMIGKPLSPGKLLELAEELGSDVPFFLLGGTAAGFGRGTELYPLADLPGRPALLVTPGIHCSTPDAYQALARMPAGQGFRPPRDFELIAWQASDAYTNDFETVVFRQHPQLKSIKRKLLQLGARPALMSGSGSTVFGIFEDRPARDRAAVWFRRDLSGEKVHCVTMVSRRRYRALWRRQLQEFVDSTVWPLPDRYAK
ncbi:MAG TPA: 4-(cytidine 5'-diphospho)-2-C-methyl-D-erythritol kinase [Bryobacteraceae bacterium]|nr:4-(cytidine 5'-diphospho)-2-C-methyl-D-erythritol kinase [Bryobacteraceae bacterium]